MTNLDIESLGTSPLNEDQKLSLFKRFIVTQEGWQVIARSIVKQSADNPVAKEICVGYLQKIAGDIEVASPSGTQNTKLIAELIKQLEYHIALAKAIK